MKISGTLFVRDVFVSDKDKQGNVKQRPVEYVTFMDMETGGDVKLSFDTGHGLKVGQTVQLDATVKGRQFGNTVSLHVENYPGAKKSA